MRSDFGILLLRVGAGLFMALGHGWGKLANFSNIAGQFPDPLGIGTTLSLGLAVFAEFFCAILVVIGLVTRWAAIPVAVTMAVAAFLVHAQDPFARKELALLYLVAFIAIAFNGAGRYSVDDMRWRRR